MTQQTPTSVNLTLVRTFQKWVLILELGGSLFFCFSLELGTISGHRGFALGMGQFLLNPKFKTGIFQSARGGSHS